MKVGTDEDAHLERLVDEGDLAAVLERVSLSDIARAWARYSSRDDHNGGDDSHDDVVEADWWAIEFWQGLAFEREDIARAGLLTLIEAVPDSLLGHVGAGPLESFICPDRDRIEWLETIAATSPRLRKALANVWVWGVEPDWVSERLERAAGVPLARGATSHGPA